ncbi:MAG: tetratricopeptide repeat protein [Treponema sp.]|jgi:tetratricopeptide (TPR) repeat protein|nr:tetratricopeptide repeat protein [Treponema sp.]
MFGITLILIAIIILVLGVIAAMFFLSHLKGTGAGLKRKEDRDAAVRTARKRLTQNPHDIEALTTLGDIYFQDETWDKAHEAYAALVELAPNNPNIDEFEVYMRYGLAALKMESLEEAYKGLSKARSINQNNFELNYNMGALEFQRKNYDKAIQFLQIARTQDPEHPPTLRCLGHTFFKVKKYKDAMAFIRKAIDLAPEDKESLYTLAECYWEAGQIEQALKIFSHLRPDPLMGPSACLASGTINMEQHKYDRAIEDFEIALKHQNIKSEILADIKYRIAAVYLKKNEIAKAMPYLKEIQQINPSYKDVSVLLGKYQELNANRNLQVFLMAPSGDFVALCRKLVINYYPRAKVKIANISVNKNEWADLLAEVDTPKWSDVVMFRFIRTQGSVGELVVRDFHSHLKEVKAGKGICITVGNFSDGARRFTEARLIDLIEKDRLNAMLTTMDARPQGSAAAKAAK